MLLQGSSNFSEALYRDLIYKNLGTVLLPWVSSLVTLKSGETVIWEADLFIQEACKPRQPRFRDVGISN